MMRSVRCSRCLRATAAVVRPTARCAKAPTGVEGLLRRSMATSHRTISTSLSLTRSPLTTRSISLSYRPTTLLPNIKTSSRTSTRHFSTSPSLSAPRNTFKPSHFVRKRRHGFLSRIRTRKGRAIIARRKAKRRSTLSH